MTWSSGRSRPTGPPPSDRPADRHVFVSSDDWHIYRASLSGGPDWAHPRTVQWLFGGQGTLNVNSWAPDSERFAYISYPILGNVDDSPSTRRS